MKRRYLAPLLLCMLIGLFGCTDGELVLIDGDATSPTCQSDPECGGGEICLDGVCRLLCSEHLPCPDGLACDVIRQICLSVDGDVPDGDTPDGDPQPERQCFQQTVWQRIGDESWEIVEVCEHGLFCEDGECRHDNCDPDTYRCADTQRVERCNSYQVWSLYQACPSGSFCLEGDCVQNEPDGDGEMESAPDGDAEADDGCIICNLNSDCEGDSDYCFYLSEYDSSGCCRRYCDQAGGSCPRGYACRLGVCDMIEGYCTTDSQCALDSFCDKRPGSSDGICERFCFNPGEQCPNGSYCESDAASVDYGRCVPETDCLFCGSDDHCEANYYCDTYPGMFEGCCAERCIYNEDCPAQTGCCLDGRCRPECLAACDCGTCPVGTVCDPTSCTCVLNCPVCPEGEYCNAQTAPDCFPGACFTGWCVVSTHCCDGFECCGSNGLWEGTCVPTGTCQIKQ